MAIRAAGNGAEIKRIEVNETLSSSKGTHDSAETWQSIFKPAIKSHRELLQRVTGSSKFTPKRAVQKRISGRRTSIIPALRANFRQPNLSQTCETSGKVSTRLSGAATHALETRCSLLEHPLNAPRVLVAETQLVIQGRKAMGLARFFHFIQLRKLQIYDFR